jgi:predicted RNase H-like HicB family nuclease
MGYLVAYESLPNNYTAFVPDLPGCVATGHTRAEVQRNIRDAIATHVSAMREDGETVPNPSAWAEEIDEQGRVVVSVRRRTPLAVTEGAEGAGVSA